jgi:hypothetical protein
MEIWWPFQTAPVPGKIFPQKTVNKSQIRKGSLPVAELFFET